MRWPSRGEVKEQLKLLGMDLSDLTTSLTAYRTWLDSSERLDSKMEELASFLRFLSLALKEASEHASEIERRASKFGPQPEPFLDCYRYWTAD